MRATRGALFVLVLSCWGCHHADKGTSPPPGADLGVGPGDTSDMTPPPGGGSSDLASPPGGGSPDLAPPPGGGSPDLAPPTGGGSPDMTPTGPSCPSPTPPDPLRAQRDACTFAANAMPADTLGVSEQERAAIPIKHIIVVMKENRSFDHLFGQLHASGQPDAEPVPATWTNLDNNGVVVAPHHEVTTCDKSDPPHQWVEMHAQSDGGKMDGFVKSGANSSPASDGHFTMGYYDATDIPFYYWLANTFSIADHYFPSVLSGTWANRDYLVAATSSGIKNTGDKQFTGTIIFDKLDTAKVSWNVYTDDWAPLEFSVSWAPRKAWGRVSDFMAAANGGTLPSVSFVDADTPAAPPETDEHPPSDVQAGEDWTRKLYETIVHSPQWPETVLLFTYDEAGGFADHVPPPSSCAPSADQAEFTELGIRVPLIVVSPWARRHYVSHVVHQHTSILRFIELLFDVPAMTARDANSDALLDMFDFKCPQTVPIPDPPAAGTGRCM
jgi:phospholipase C